MSIADALADAGAKPAGKRPYFFANPEVERVLAVTMAVVQELAVTRARLDTLERVLEAQGGFDRAQIERFEPSAQAAAERGLWLQEYLARVLRIVQQEAEAAVATGDVASEDVAVELRD
ncbi:hypothetical protein DMC25_24265 [Caulobacter sp. D4A]|uniref:hypothetical protein n=1 Tax=unclassified Caulobacter TaxID=2648921 RepID=UPI000D73F116|nr:MULTISPECIES: hypothetical protein [unclassified Caulobacter]PXA75922.1 hypothetical protein DMC25_24265 [Caulobacter sp. D4A]PXA90105.1 hypothetical protein DMC18_15395 [Caulobacter sp. D5]